MGISKWGPKCYWHLWSEKATSNLPDPWLHIHEPSRSSSPGSYLRSIFGHLHSGSERLRIRSSSLWVRIWHCFSFNSYSIQLPVLTSDHSSIVSLHPARTKTTPCSPCKYHSMQSTANLPSKMKWTNLFFKNLTSVYRVQNNIIIFQKYNVVVHACIPSIQEAEAGAWLWTWGCSGLYSEGLLGLLSETLFQTDRQTERQIHADRMVHSEVVLSPYAERPITQRLQLLWVGSKMSDPLTHWREVTREECMVAMGMPRDHLSGNSWPDSVSWRQPIQDRGEWTPLLWQSAAVRVNVGDNGSERPDSIVSSIRLGSLPRSEWWQ